jgi:hypothetical protein
MRAEQIRKFDMLRRVQQFLGTWAARLGGVAATAAKKELDAVTREMGGNESLQATATIAARGETAKLRVLRRDLVNHHMRPVATIAAAHLRDVPDFTALQLPDRKAKLAVLMQDAAAMADKAAQHQQVFVDNGRSADFIARLSAAAAAVRVSPDARAASITQPGFRMRWTQGERVTSAPADAIARCPGDERARRRSQAVGRVEFGQADRQGKSGADRGDDA